MKTWLTEFEAKCPKTGQLKTYCGENVEAPTWRLAQQWCNENRGHLTVIGQLISVVPE